MNLGIKCPLTGSENYLTWTKHNISVPSRLKNVLSQTKRRRFLHVVINWLFNYVRDCANIVWTFWKTTYCCILMWPTVYKAAQIKQKQHSFAENQQRQWQQNIKYMLLTSCFLSSNLQRSFPFHVQLFGCKEVWRTFFQINLGSLGLLRLGLPLTGWFYAFSSFQFKKKTTLQYKCAVKNQKCFVDEWTSP